MNRATYLQNLTVTDILYAASSINNVPWDLSKESKVSYN